MLQRVDEVADRLDDRGVVLVVVDGPRLDRRSQFGEVERHLTECLLVLLPGLGQDEVLHQRPTLGGGELADGVDDPAILLRLPIAVDQSAPLLGGAESNRLEELAVMVDVRQRVRESGRDAESLGPRCAVRRLEERPDLGRVRLRGSDTELQFLGAELREWSDLLELPGG